MLDTVKAKLANNDGSFSLELIVIVIVVILVAILALGAFGNEISNTIHKSTNTVANVSNNILSQF